MEPMAKLGSERIEGSPYAEAWAEVGGSCCRRGRKRMRQTHISPSLIYPAVDIAHHITIDCTTTSDSYSAFMTPTSHLNNMNGNWYK